MGEPSGHVNQGLANLIIDKQLLAWDPNDLRNSKKMYLISKTWLFLDFDSFMLQQFIFSIETKIYLIENQKQEKITPAPAHISSIPPIHQETIIFDLTNTFDLTTPICQPTITPIPTQFGFVSPPDWPQQAFNAYRNPYIQIPPIKVLNEMLPATIVTQFVKIWDNNSNYIGEAYNILNDQIRYFFDICYTFAIKQSQFHVVFSSILSGRAKDYFVYNINQNMMFTEIYNKIKI